MTFGAQQDNEEVIKHFRDNIIPKARAQALEASLGALSQQVVLHFMNEGGENAHLAAEALVSNAAIPEWADEEGMRNELGGITGKAVGDMLAHISQFADDYLNSGENAVFLMRSVVVAVRYAGWLALGKDKGEVPESVKKYLTEPVSRLVKKLKESMSEWVEYMKEKYTQDEEKFIADLSDPDSPANQMLSWQQALEALRDEQDAAPYN